MAWTRGFPESVDVSIMVAQVLVEFVHLAVGLGTMCRPWTK
jgi:hypothetical protein